MAKERILIVDDDPSIVGMLRQFLAKQGYEPLVAQSGKEAIAAVRREHPAIVLLDVRLPDANGLDLLTKQLHPELGDHRVIMMSGYGTREDAEKAVLQGAHDFLIKPIPLSRLGVMIRNCLRLNQLAQEVTDLSGGAARPAPLRELVGTSPKMLALVERIKQVAPFDVPVLILGESGTGKELVARAIHTLSPRCKGPYVAVDCGALPDTLVEAEVFGYERGAFSGADQAKPGKIEQAQGGTLLLDEIGNIPPVIQPKLLRVLQSRAVDRLGGRKPVPVDVRIISATNADIERMIAQDRFRRDLYYRLNTVTLMVPPLRDRPCDIPLLAHYTLMAASRVYRKPIRGISSEAMTLLEGYAWPGNVRELENCMKSAVILADQIVRPEHLSDQIRKPGIRAEGLSERREGLNLSQIRRQAADEAERTAIVKVLEETGGNKAEAARRFGVDYKTLFVKIRAYAIPPSKKSS
ncbi:MAG: sigma-54-dependent Fis family transcriptional regulator [Nitrospirae bacterium]|nr:MAG: sigma-54-dependent Fis family transcriptional regulator [Nitrospirota bacterium]